MSPPFSESKNIKRSPSMFPASRWCLTWLIPRPEGIRTCSSETSVQFQLTTRRYIPGDRTLRDHRCENLKSYILFISVFFLPSLSLFTCLFFYIYFFLFLHCVCLSPSFIIHSPLHIRFDVITLKTVVSGTSCVMHSRSPCNMPWRPMGLWDIKAPTFNRQSADCWRWVFFY
jgi:hypothetical protein